MIDTKHGQNIMTNFTFEFSQLGNTGYAYAEKMNELNLIPTYPTSLDRMVDLLNTIQPNNIWFKNEDFIEDLYSALVHDFGYKISIG